MAILKVIEVLANSEKSWEDATKKAVEQASKSVKNIRSVYVQDQSASVKDGEISDFRVNVKITFEVKQFVQNILKAPYMMYGAFFAIT